MSRSLVPALACIAIISLAGCKKDEPPSVAPVAPDDRSNGPPDLKGKDGATERDEAVNLSPYMIRGEITVPQGCKVRRRLAPGTCAIDGGKEFTIEIAPAVAPLEATRSQWSTLDPQWVKDEPNVLLAELRGISPGTYAFEARVKLGDQTYRLQSPTAVRITREQAERMLRSALSLQQTEAIKASMKREPEVIAALKKAGSELRDEPQGRTLVVGGNALTDDLLAGVSDIAGIGSVALRTAPKLTADGIAKLASLRGVSRLSLSQSGVGDPMAAPFKAMAGIRELVIDEPNLTDAGLAFTAGLTDLEELDLRVGKPGQSGAKINGACLQYMRGLKVLRKATIVGESVDDVAMENLAEIKSIRELRLERVRITDNGLGYLERLKNLERADILGAPIRGIGLSSVTGLSKLKSLHLDGCPISDGGLDRMRGANIEDLSLAQAAVTDAGMKILAEMPSLHTLNLQDTKVTDAGLVHLARIKGLSDLNLSGTNILGSGLSHLKAKPDLERLSLADTLVGDDALGELAGCPNLSFLNLSETTITDVGLDKLQAVRNLRTVSLASTDVTKAGVDRLKGAIRGIAVEWSPPTADPDPKPVSPPVAIDKLPPADPAALIKKYEAQTKTDDSVADKPVVSVSLQGSAVTDSELAHLRAWKSLRVLNLKGCEKITDAALAYVALLPELTELNLSGTSVKGDGVIHLKGLVDLVTLDLPDARMTVKQVAPLAASKDLQRFRVSLPLESDAALKFMAGFPKLREIDLREAKLTNRQMAYVARMRGLERLDINSDRVGDRGFGYVKDLKKLQELHLTNTAVTDVGLKTLGEMTGLKALEIAGPRLTDAGLLNIRLLTELERLKVSNTAMTDRSLQYIRDCSKLIELELRGADVTDKGLLSLAEMKNIEWIDLSGTHVTDAGLKHMKMWEELRKLTIEDSAITGTGFAALRKLKRLSRIQLNRSRMSEEGLATIAELKEPDELYLSLESMRLTDSGIARLMASQNLRELSLNGVTGLTDKVADILKSFSALTDVSIRGTGLSPTAIAELKKKEGLTVTSD
jgi:Leucine-rich repeat (LRR) protein